MIGIETFEGLRPNGRGGDLFVVCEERIAEWRLQAIEMAKRTFALESPQVLEGGGTALTRVLIRALAQ
jgi:hypothetical protein